MKLVGAIAFALAGLLVGGAAEPLGPTEGYVEARGAISGYTTDTAGHHSVNGYWIEGETGLILIDTHWRLSDARRALAAMRQRTEKPILAVLLTHPHSDHFGGLPVFLEAANGKATYYASAWTARSIRNDEQGFRANREEQFGADFPAALPDPDRIIRHKYPIEIDGVTIIPHILRENEAVESVVFHLPEENALFTGDLVNNATLPILYQGGLDSWIAQLKVLRETFPDVVTVYPGHGPPGDPDELIDGEIAILETHRDLIASALDEDGAVDRAEREAIKDAIEKRFPSWRTTAGLPGRRLVIEQNITWALRGWRIASGGAGEGDAREFRIEDDGKKD